MKYEKDRDELELFFNQTMYIPIRVRISHV